MACRWDEGIEIGVESLDAEHRLQVSLVNALQELLRGGNDPPLASRTMTQLIEFTRVHFLSEELMMRIYAYPGSEAHAAEHGRLTDQVSEIQGRLERGGAGEAVETIQALHRWLVNHIRTMDQGFALWCANNGIAPR